MRVEVLPADSDQPGAGMPAVAGAYSVTDAAVRFTPSFPFDPGARYRVAIDTGKLPGGSPGVTTAIVGRPAQLVTAPPATVTSVAPGGDVVPENVLRLYLHFSAPMGRRGGERARAPARRQTAGRSSTRSCRSRPSCGTATARATRCSSIRGE